MNAAVADGGEHAAAAARRLLRWVLLGYLVFVIYGSLVPLNFQPIPLTQAWARFQQAPMLSLGMASRADLVANLLLFVPLSFLLRELQQSPGPLAWRLLQAGLLWGLCSALAVGIEFTQVFFPGRTVSLNDISAESAGAALGLLLHPRVAPPLRRWLQGWWLQERGQPFATRLLHGYLLLLCIFSVMPLDLTISVVELYHKWHEGRLFLLPFADLRGAPMQIAWDLGTDTLLWLPVGVLWRLSGRSVAQALRRGLLLAFGMEFLQLFVYSRVTSVTDVLTGGLGCAIGAAVVPLVVRAALLSGGGDPTPAEHRPYATTSRPARWLMLYVAWAVLMLAAFWYPYNVDLSAGFLKQRLADAVRLPFVTYYFGTEFRALNELLRKMLMFLPGGLLWYGHVATAPSHQRSRLLGLGAIAALALALMVEAGQLLLPEKVADLTDALLEAVGAWIGLALGRRLFAADAIPIFAEPTRPVARAAHSSAVAPARSAPWLLDLASLALLTLLLFFASGSERLPYNVRELFLPGIVGALGTAVALALACWWLFALPLALLARWRRRPEHALRLVVGLPLLGLIGVLPLLAAVPRESLDDIVGSPVLGWPDPLETVLRYIALHGSVALAMIGAAWLVARLTWRRASELLPRWVVVAVLWVIPLHWVVVEAAATDNLTELMRGGGGPLASLCLFFGLLALFSALSALAAMLVVPRRRLRLAVTVLLAWPAGTALLWMGSEPLIIKYGRVFSAAQFLLSVDRERYANGSALSLRFALACLGLGMVVALLQAPHWRRLAIALNAERQVARWVP